MNPFRLLVVEDNEQDLHICKASVDRYQSEHQRTIEMVACKTIEEAFQKLDNSFDGAIIDLKLADQGDAGNQVIQEIVKSYFRIPIAVLTGTPSNADNNFGS